MTVSPTATRAGRPADLTLCIADALQHLPRERIQKRSRPSPYDHIPR